MITHEDLKSEVRTVVVPCSEIPAAMERIILAKGKILTVVPVPTGYQIVSQHDKRAPAEVHFHIHDLVAELRKVPPTRPERPSMAFRMQAETIEPWVLAFAPARLADVLDPRQNSYHLLDREEMAYLLVRAYQAGRFEAAVLE